MNNTITQEILIDYIERFIRRKSYDVYSKDKTIFINIIEESNDLKLENIDSAPISLKTNPVICCTYPESSNDTLKNYYGKTLQQHKEQHIPIINGLKYTLNVPLIDSNNSKKNVNLDFIEVNSNTYGIPFKYDENDDEIVKLFKLFETFNIISPWNEILNKDDIKNKIIFAKLEHNNIVEVYIIENNPDNPIFDNTFKKTNIYYIINR